MRARDLVADGALGRITGVSYRYAGPYHRDVEARVGRRRRRCPGVCEAEHAGGGLFLDLGCHTLDILDFILGPLEEVRGTATNVATPQQLVEDAVAMTFRTAAGAPGTAQWNFASAERADEIVIAGERGELRLSTFGNEPVELRRGDSAERFDLPQSAAHPAADDPDHRRSSCAAAGRCDSTGVSAARTSAVIDAVLLGYYGTRADGFWRAPEAWPGRRLSARS